MRAAGRTYDHVQAARPLTRLPARLALAPAGTITAVRMLLLVPATLALLAPALAAVHVLGSIGPTRLYADQPLALVALIGLPLVWLALALVTARSIVPRLGGWRRVHVGRHTVRVTERSLGAVQRWREPLSGYRGIAHDVKATLGSSHHTLVLVHPRPERSILLAADDHISQQRIDETAHLLGLPQIPARELYRLPALRVPGLIAAQLNWAPRPA